MEEAAVRLRTPSFANRRSTCTLIVPGLAQANFNGVDVGAPTDLFDTAVKPADPIDLGEVILTDAPSVLKFTITGKNNASPGTLFGLDYIKLVPAP